MPAERAKEWRQNAVCHQKRAPVRRWREPADGVVSGQERRGGFHFAAVTLRGTNRPWAPVMEGVSNGADRAVPELVEDPTG